jgi:hypothetical protein
MSTGYGTLELFYLNLQVITDIAKTVIPWVAAISPIINPVDSVAIGDRCAFNILGRAASCNSAELRSNVRGLVFHFDFELDKIPFQARFRVGSKLVKIVGNIKGYKVEEFSLRRGNDRPIEVTPRSGSCAIDPLPKTKLICAITIADEFKTGEISFKVEQ